ncbi:flavin reductase family protein (plasmid) [Rhodococcus qingshengii]|uniref:flavin reductase family protein n=1 Tax=Rhodococcus TaxID=1827 RepID=UPI000F61697C|nr:MULTISPECIES: flavin reductase family protein [Rhodococcus]AZI65865.1 flavin reductase [Rhodococcus sp. NJ-530]BDQ23816.1 flavin reductase family protein [Rhodococcus qingshengii]
MNTEYATETPRLSHVGPSAVRDHFREVLSHFGSGVVVITAVDRGGAPVGLTVGSFASISIEPPLVGFFVGHASATLPHVIAARSFCVNVLAEEQHLVAKSFARSGTDKFAGVDWNAGRKGIPLLTGAHAHIECTLYEHRAIGDHDLVVGHVDALTSLTDTAPLIFHKSTFRQLRDHQ